MHNRIPSWLHMSAVGLPAVASWGDSEFAEAAASIAAAAASGGARGTSWGTPHAAATSLVLADAAAAGGGIGDGGLPPLPMPPPAPSTGRRSGVATGVAGGPSPTHPLAVAASMTTSTLALLNLGGGGLPGGAGVGSPPRGLGVLGSSPGPRGGMPASYSLAALQHGGRGAGGAVDGLPRPRYSDGGMAFASPGCGGGGTAATAAGAVSGVPVALGAVPAAAVHANGHHHNGVLGGPHHHGAPHHGHGGHGLGLGTIGGLMGGLMGGVDGLLRMGSSPQRFGPLSGYVGGGATGTVAGGLRGVGTGGGGGGGASAVPTLPTWVDAASECEDSASDAAAQTAGSTGAGSSSAAGAAGGTAGGGEPGSGRNSRSDSAGRISQELLDLAYCDCTDSSARDLWSTLLPLAQQSVSLGETAPARVGGGASATGLATAAAARRAGGTSDPDALDVFAY